MYNFVMYETNCVTKIIFVKYMHGEHKIKVEFKSSNITLKSTINKIITYTIKFTISYLRDVHDRILFIINNRIFYS